MSYLKKMESDSCVGCSACKAVCPSSAITLRPDKYGFEIPDIDAEVCVDCGLCVDVCQAIHMQQYNPEICKVFAVRHKDDGIRYNSASGAFFQAVASQILKLGGCVCGCVLDTDMRVKHIVSRKMEDISKMADSKYVQSSMENCFSQIEDNLKRNVPILFSGCSCQVAGLKMYLARVNAPTQNLLCIDFFCHGVPSPLVWKEYLKFCERKAGQRITGYRFRSKKFGWGKTSRGGHYLCGATFECPSGEVFSYDYCRWTSSIFTSDLTLRNCCFSCPYTTVDKPADITMGDFWGIEKTSAVSFDDGKGCSIAIFHNKAALDYVMDIEILDHCEVTVEEGIKKQKNAREACTKPEKYDLFWEEYWKKGFETTAKKYFGYNIRGRVKRAVKLLLWKLKLHNV